MRIDTAITRGRVARSTCGQNEAVTDIRKLQRTHWSRSGCETLGWFTPLAYEMVQWNPASLGSQGALVTIHRYMTRDQRIVDIRWWEKSVPGTAVVAALRWLVS
jgi:hypothetical protein